jgi:hypothetical protein
MIVVVVLAGLVIGIVAVLVAGLLRGYGDIARAMHSIGLGSGREPARNVTAPRTEGPSVPRLTDIAGVTPAGDAIAVGVTSSSRNSLLAFLSSGCLTCAELWSELRDPASPALPVGTNVIVVTKGPDAESPSAIRELAPSDMTVVMSTRAWLDYGIPGSPYFALVDGTAGKVVVEGPANKWSHVAALVAQAIGDREVPHRRHAPAIAASDQPERVDAALLAAGITPGHESLFFAPRSQEPDS